MILYDDDTHLCYNPYIPLITEWKLNAPCYIANSFAATLLQQVIEIQDMKKDMPLELSVVLCVLLVVRVTEQEKIEMRMPAAVVNQVNPKPSIYANNCCKIITVHIDVRVMTGGKSRTEGDRRWATLKS